MALIPQCDRCGAPRVQLVPVLGVEICNVCIGETRTFLLTPPERSCTKRHARTEQALRICAAKGTVNATEIAYANGERRRAAYFRLMGLAKQGKLVHAGGGVFRLPAQQSVLEAV